MQHWSALWCFTSCKVFSGCMACVGACLWPDRWQWVSLPTSDGYGQVDWQTEWIERQQCETELPREQRWGVGSGNGSGGSNLGGQVMLKEMKRSKLGRLNCYKPSRPTASFLSPVCCQNRSGLCCGSLLVSIHLHRTVPHTGPLCCLIIVSCIVHM